MAKMKDAMLCEIELLARMAGYDPEELLEIYYEVMDECQEDGVPFDAASFARITLERDW